jgi:tRNA-2-methylthio-N6-dimethylallyladenosine synthase
MNTYDSDKAADILVERYNMERTEHASHADVILLITCSVREKAQQKLFSDLGRLRRLKKHRDVIIGVGGCVASQEAEGITKRAPYVDLVFGPQTVHKVADLYQQALNNKNRIKKIDVIDVSFPEIEKFDHLPTPTTSSVSNYVTIMEGCSKFCSFCIVPYTRGQEISRPFNDVLVEIDQLAELGAKEIILLGQNVNDYYGIMDDGQHADLALLIHYVAAIEGVQRIRFSTSHPNAFANNLIDAYREEKKLANQLHLPVQSGSDRILGLMKRGYTVRDFEDKIGQLRMVRPDISITSDFIVGYPGETDADFQATIELVKRVKFDKSFCFIYSERPGTKASELEDDVPLAVKKDRVNILLNSINQHANAISKKMINQVHAVLFTQASKTSDTIQGRTENNRIVHVATSKKMIGKILPVLITEVLPNAMRGTLI